MGLRPMICLTALSPASFHRAFGIVDVEQELRGVLDAPGNRGRGFDDVLIAGEHLHDRAVADLDLVDRGHARQHDELDRIGPVIVEPRSSGFDQFAKSQHKADLIGLDPVKSARRPNGERERDGDENARKRQDAPRARRRSSKNRRGGRRRRWRWSSSVDTGSTAFRPTRALAAQAIEPGLDAGGSHIFGTEVARLSPHDVLAGARGADRE